LDSASAREVMARAIRMIVIAAKARVSKNNRRRIMRVF
jgi:hypothetical protein